MHATWKLSPVRLFVLLARSTSNAKHSVTMSPVYRKNGTTARIAAQRKHAAIVENLQAIWFAFQPNKRSVKGNARVPLVIFRGFLAWGICCKRTSAVNKSAIFAVQSLRRDKKENGHFERSKTLSAQGHAPYISAFYKLLNCTMYRSFVPLEEVKAFFGRNRCT